MSKSNSLPTKLWKFFSGFGLATSLLVTLGVLTWLATLEMVDAGLLATLQKYFHWKSWYVLAKLDVLPDRFDRSLTIPLPGGYWVCALLLVNMILGGLIRARKGWRTAGVLLSHFGIIFMIAAGGVSQLFEERGVMMLVEGQQADFAVSLTDPTIEVMQIVDGEVSGDVSVARERELSGMQPSDKRLVVFPDRPFDLEVTGWLGNAMVRPGGEGSVNEVVDGWTLINRPLEKAGELNAQACYARPVFEDGSKGGYFILAVPSQMTGLDSFAPTMVEAGDQLYAVRMVKETIGVPYQVKLKDAVSEYYPNSNRPKEFLSDIERIDEGLDGVPIRISMNEPMREGGYTFFQRTMGGGPRNQQGPEFSGFEVVSNPADRWPEYGLYVVTLGLLIHFVMMFTRYVMSSTRDKKEA